MLNLLSRNFTTPKTKTLTIELHKNFNTITIAYYYFLSLSISTNLRFIDIKRLPAVSRLLFSVL